MIEVTRLNGKAFSINALYIETVEAFPDTTITLTTGRKFIVLESEEEVRAKDYSVLSTYSSVIKPASKR